MRWMRLVDAASAASNKALACKTNAARGPGLGAYAVSSTVRCVGDRGGCCCAGLGCANELHNVV